MSVTIQQSEELQEKMERNKNWTQPFPIITENVRFSADSYSNSKCKSCRGNCCFFEHSEKFPGHPDAEMFRKYYSEEQFKILEHNLDNMTDFLPQPIIGPEDPWLVGNRNWVKIFYDRKKDEVSIRYACPVLNIHERCSVYPGRPEQCKDNSYNRCNLELVSEKKLKGPITK